MLDKSSTAFWSPEFDVERREDGSILMQQRGELPDYLRALPDRLHHWAKERADQIYLAQRDASGRWEELSYADVLSRVQRLGSALLAQGLGPARPLLILSENSLEHALLGLAAQYVGVPYAPLSPAYSLLSRDHAKLRAIVALLKPGLIFAQSGARYQQALTAVCSDDCEVLVVEKATDAKTLLFTDFLEYECSDEAHCAYELLGASTIAKYLFTSGSTGVPKAVINTQQMLCSNQAMIADCFRFMEKRSPVVLDWSPWNHTAGGNKVFNMVLYNGGTFFIDEGKPTPDGIKQTIANLREISPTWYFNVPTGWDMLLAQFDQDIALRERFFARLDMMMYAGAGMAQHTWDGLLGYAQQSAHAAPVLVSGLGATETGPFTLMCTDQQTQAGNIGVPAKGVSLKLVPSGDSFEARLKSPSITPGYYGDAEASALAFDAEGYFRLGDALRPADLNNLSRGFFFDGRTAENFKLATGTWVAVGSLRAALINHCAGLIRDAIVVGENRPYLGALVVPTVALADQTEDQIEFLREQLQTALSRFAALATGSSMRISRMIVLADALDMDKGEVTDKGSINQRAVCLNRAALIDELYAGEPSVLQA